MSAPFVWVAHVPTRYAVVGVGRTQSEACRVASRRAWEYLEANSLLTDETDTPKKVAQYFGVHAVYVEIGEGVIYD